MSRTTKKSKATPKAAPDSRRTERILALYRYEASPESGGVSPFELMGDLLEEVHSVMLNPPGEARNGDLTEAQMDRLRTGLDVLARHLLVALAETGHADDAEAFIEGRAALRRECAARFGQELEVPRIAGEREVLAKKWDAVKAEADAARASEEVH